MQISCIPRLTINAKCPMNLLDYPMDAPVCPLLLAGCTVWNRQYLNASNIIHCYNYLQLLDDTVYYLFSDGYTTDEIIYRWQTSNKSGVEIYDDVTLSQFDIVSIWTANNTYSDALGKYFTSSSSAATKWVENLTMLYIIFIYITGTQSGLEVYFHLKRHIGFFMLQVC